PPPTHDGRAREATSPARLPQRTTLAASQAAAKTGANGCGDWCKRLWWVRRLVQTAVVDWCNVVGGGRMQTLRDGCLSTLWHTRVDVLHATTTRGAAQTEDQAKASWRTRAGARGGVHRELQMLEDLPDHLAVRDGGDAPQRPLRTARAARHSQ